MFLECASFTNGQTLKPNQTCISQQNFTSNEIEHSECKLNPPRQLLVYPEDGVCPTLHFELLIVVL